jgi:hypothetical protein
MFKRLLNGLHARARESDDHIPQPAELPFEAPGHKAFIFHDKDTGGVAHGDGIPLLGRTLQMTILP